MSKNYNIAVVPGDGIGNEIVPEGYRVLKAVAKKYGFSITSDTFDILVQWVYRKLMTHYRPKTILLK